MDSTVSNLAENQLRFLPDGIFDDLVHLTHLHLDYNYLHHIPDKILAPLNSLEILTMVSLWNNFTLFHFGEGFTSLTHLQQLQISGTEAPLQWDLTNKTFEKLSKSPLKSFELTFTPPEKQSTVEAGVFKPVQNLTNFITTGIFQYEMFDESFPMLQKLFLGPSPGCK